MAHKYQKSHHADVASILHEAFEAEPGSKVVEAIAWEFDALFTEDNNPLYVSKNILEASGMYLASLNA